MKHNRQSGVILFVALIALLILGLLAISAMNNASLEERMAGNTREVNVAFQAAEAGLRDGEADVQASVTPYISFSSTCSGGLCSLPSVSIPRALSIDWNNTAVSRAYGSQTGATPLSNVSAQPRYIIELLPNLPPVLGQSVALGIKPLGLGTAYRVTALGYGARADSQTVLQSVYVKR